MKHFFPCGSFGWGSSQREPGDVVPLTAINDVQEIFVLARLIRADIDEEVGVLAKGGDEFLLDLVNPHHMPAQRHLAGGADVHGADVGLLEFVVGATALRERQVQALLKQRRGDDENDQEHERQIQQRRDVDVTQRHERIALGKAAHG